MRRSTPARPPLPALLLLVPAAALLGSGNDSELNFKTMFAEYGQTLLKLRERHQRNTSGEKPPQLPGWLKDRRHNRSSEPLKRPSWLPVEGTTDLTCKNGTKYRTVRGKKYGSVPCDVPCWSTRCVDVGGPCEDPSGFMCNQAEFERIAYGDYAEPVFVDGLPRTRIDFPAQSLSLYANMEAIEGKHPREMSATTSLKSAVPLQYLEFTGPLQTPNVDFDAVVKGASMMISHCSGSKNGIVVDPNTASRFKVDLQKPGSSAWFSRIWLAQSLMGYLKVDSFGKCLHNREFPANAESGHRPVAKFTQKASVAKKYLFHFAFENTIKEDYVTEKMWDMLRAGTLPVYFGASNIHELVPMKAFVNVADFKTADDLGTYLAYLAQNKTAYMQYHKWRSEPLPRAFKEKWGFARVHSVCRACRWAYSKREMLRWDPARQRVAPRAGPRASNPALVPAAHRRRRSFV